MPHDSYHRLESALRRFSERKEPGALLLRGAWGIGKTFACLNALKAKNRKDQPSFSYVSLYGVSRLDEIYERVALGWNNSVTERAPDWLREAIGTSGKEFAKGIADIFKLGGLGGLANAIGTAGIGLLAKNTLIVLDDLERRDESLSVNAALGVVSHLVESRNCRVIFISNDDALEGNDKVAFAAQKEKVFELEYVYARLPFEKRGRRPRRGNRGNAGGLQLGRGFADMSAARVRGVQSVQGVEVGHYVRLENANRRSR